MGEVIRAFAGQMTIDGTEVPLAAVPVAAKMRAPKLTPTQRGILEHLRAEGGISPRDAGMILYRNQGQEWRERYASSDGSEVLRRMARRGLVHKQGRGRWVAGPHPEGKIPGERRSERLRRERAS